MDRTSYEKYDSNSWFFGTQMMYLSRLESIAQQEGVPLADLSLHDPGRMERVIEFLVEFNERGGFFSKADSELDRILGRHVLESVVIVNRVSGFLEGEGVSRETIGAGILDVGSGPGLPGLFFATMHTPWAVVLLDSSRRRLGLTEQFIDDSSGFPIRPRFAYSRAEEYSAQHQAVVTRAFVPLPVIPELVTRAQPRDALLFCAVANPPISSGKEVPAAWARAGYVSRETIRLPELDFLGSRSISVLRKDRSPATGYPRPWKAIQAELRSSLWKTKS